MVSLVRSSRGGAPRRGLGGSSTRPEPVRHLGRLEAADEPRSGAWGRWRRRWWREDNPQATWTGGSRLASRAVTIAACATMAAGPVALVLQALPEAPVTGTGAVAVGYDARMESRRSIASETALGWVRAWLTTPAASAAALEAYYSGPVVLPKTAAAAANMRVVDAVPADVGVWSVSVVADVTPAGAKASMTRYYRVPVAVSGGGDEGPVSAAALAVPAPVAGPGRAPGSVGGDYGVAVAMGSPLFEAVSAFLAAYVTGADVARFVSPGAVVDAIGEPGVGYGTAQVMAVRAAQPVDAQTAPGEGQRVQVMATVRLSERGVVDPQQQIQAEIPLTLAGRGGRWEISAVDEALARHEAPSAPQNQTP